MGSLADRIGTSQDRLTYDEVIAALRPHIGRRARVTHPNGFFRVGEIGTWREYLTLASHLCGGEYAGAVRVEIMGENGRYQQVCPLCGWPHWKGAPCSPAKP